MPGYGMGAVPGAVNKIGKTRNPWGVFGLTLVTLGIYGLWWYYTELVCRRGGASAGER